MIVNKVYFIGSLQNPAIPQYVFPVTEDGLTDLASVLWRTFNAESYTNSHDTFENEVFLSGIEDLILLDRIDDVNDFIRSDGIEIYSLDFSREIETLPYDGIHARGVYFIRSMQNPEIPMEVVPPTERCLEDLASALTKRFNVESYTHSHDELVNNKAQLKIEELIREYRIDDVNDIICSDGLKIDVLKFTDIVDVDDHYDFCL